MIVLILALAAAQASALPVLQPGAVVTLGPGPYPLIAITGQTFDPPVTINAGNTVVNGLRIWDSRGIIWRGGVIKAPAGPNTRGPDGYGADVRKTDALTFDGTVFTQALRGAVIADSTNIVVRNAHFTALRSDGLNAVGNNHMLLENNRFDNFNPVKATGSKADKTWVDGDHPDAIQIWNTPTTHAGTDIVIRGNSVDGDTQGINFFGPALDGYRGVTIENNTLHISYPAAISVFKCTGCTVRNNSVSAVPGSRFKTNIRYVESSGVLCGNIMPAMPGHEAAQRC